MVMPEIQVIDRAESLSQRAYQSLRKAIRDGAIVHGVLYSEKDLAERLGISRTPVREALIELAREGLVTVAPQRGFRLHEMSHEEQREVFELRLAIDTYLVERLCRESTVDDIKQLREAIEAQRDAGSDAGLALSADEQFHLLFPRLLGLERSYAIASTLRGAMWLIGSSAFQAADRMVLVLAEHSAVVDAIEARDPAAAVAAVRNHLCRTLEALKETWVGASDH
jgi:DNA-binding GntR family transcriptional regulator